MSSLAESMFSFYYESTPEPDEELLEEMMYNNGATFYYESSPSSCGSSFVGEDDDEGEEKEKAAAAVRLPVELLEVIFGFVAPDVADDGLGSVRDLWSCAVTCRAWAFTAIPMLYRTHGFGVLMPITASVHNPGSKYFPTSRCIDFYNTRADLRMMQLWRTLLLSCFTVSGKSSEARNATLFPYINYVANLDARTLVMVLTEIMKSQRTTGNKSSTLGEKAAQYFFDGLLGGLEVSGASRRDKRGDKMIVGGAEYGWTSPVYGREVKVFVGDTALMIMDFLYPHIQHLKGFTIPELGQLRVHEPIRMSHPISMIYSLHNISRLVISSGWMVCAELGRAIASIRPTLIYPSTASLTQRRRHSNKSDSFSLTILDWRFKTHYDPYYSHEEDWETDHSAYNKTVSTLDSFFDALNPNSITSLDLDFDIRYSRFSGKDLGNGPLALRQSRSIRALRLARMRCDNFKLWRMFTEMGYAGFSPQSLKLINLFVDNTSTSQNFTGWSFAPGFLHNMRDLEFTKFAGMFDLAVAIIQIKNVNSQLEHSLSRGGQQSKREKSARIDSLSLSYEAKQAGSSTTKLLLAPLASLGSSLTYLKLQDTDFANPRPGSVHYSRSTVLHHSPLESLTKLKTLILAGDVSVFLLGDRLLSIIRCMRQSITFVDICLSTRDLADALLLRAFAPSENLQTLILRAWDKLVTLEPAAPDSAPGQIVPWIEYPPLLTNRRFWQMSLWPVCPKVTVEGTIGFLAKKRGGLKKFGFSRAFCRDDERGRWGEVAEVMEGMGGKFLPRTKKAGRAWDEGLPALE
ncbi:hypothetical protein HOY80DRAFT_1053594 [Tuber brumale]|nr:hypothetical protein HOY80DRAFT_1053594 [Tuber brumale]